MKTIQVTLLSTLFLACGYKLQAQSAKDKLMAERIAFFTEKINLTPSEAAIFWPVYNEYKAKSLQINSQTIENFDKFKNNSDQLSDKDIHNLLNTRLVLMNDKIILDEEYQKKFLEILPPKKVMLIYTTEIAFKTYLLHQLRNKKN